jgi:hypothetical protein
MWVTLAGLAALPMGAVLWLLRLRRPDPWRRVLGLVLRSEGSKFALSAFGLDLFSDCDGTPPGLEHGQIERHFMNRWRRFLETEEEARFAIQHDGSCVRRVAALYCDVVLGRFGEEGELQTLLLAFDPKSPVALDAEASKRICAAVVWAYNDTRELPDAERPEHLRRLSLEGNGFSLRERDFFDRMMAACFVSFEPPARTAAERCSTPRFHERRSLGGGMLRVVCRWLPGSESIDVWMQVHHVGSDGSPMQEMLSRIEETWGVKDAIVISQTNDSKPVPVAAPGERALHLITESISFEPLLALRRIWSERFSAQLGGKIPLPALLMWVLAEQPEFAGKKFAVAVDVPAAGEWSRAVNLTSISPAEDRATGVAGPPFAAFARYFEDLVAEARERRGVTYSATRALTWLPARLARAALRQQPENTDRTFGTIGLTILRAARVFVAPMSEIGFDDGFIAIGSMALQGEAGGAVAAVTIKGPIERIAVYPAAIRRALAVTQRRVEAALASGATEPSHSSVS